MSTNLPATSHPDSEISGAYAEPSSDSQDRPVADPLVQRVARGAHQTIDRIAERATPQVERLQHGLDEASQRVQRGIEQTSAATDHWAEGLRGSVRQHPLSWLAGAFGLGVVLARLSR